MDSGSVELAGGSLALGGLVVGGDDGAADAGPVYGVGRVAGGFLDAVSGGVVLDFNIGGGGRGEEMA